MSLNMRLQFLRNSMERNGGPEIAEACVLALKYQSTLANAAGVVLACPEKLPDVTLIAADGSRQSLYDLIAGKPAVLLFFRGDWCPYSTTSMRAYEDVRADLARLGVAMIGITSRHHSALADAVSKNLLSYPLLTDPDQKLIEAMGIRAHIVDVMIPLYKDLGIDLTRLNESGDWSLPLEATFLVDADRAIVCAKAFPHPAARMEPAEVRARILDMLKTREPV